jgi:hypothetical protein
MNRSIAALAEKWKPKALSFMLWCKVCVEEDVKWVGRERRDERERRGEDQKLAKKSLFETSGISRSMVIIR